MAGFFVLLMLLAAVIVSFASPLSLNTTTTLLEPRTTHTGDGTWFEVGEGNCGYYNVNSDKIVALSTGLYQTGGNCGQWVFITNTANGHTVYAMTRDSCVGCKYYDLDMSPSAFQALAPLSVGRIQISWNFMPKTWSP